MNYTILVEDNWVDLTQAVNKRLDLGWRPLGAPFKEAVHWYQAMTKEYGV